MFVAELAEPLPQLSFWLVEEMQNLSRTDSNPSTADGMEKLHSVFGAASLCLSLIYHSDNRLIIID